MSGPRRSEKSIQNSVVKYAKQWGWHAWKRSTLGPFGTNGQPDYEFRRAPRTIFFIEFKAPGKTSTEKQKDVQDELRDEGFPVFECDEVLKGRRIIDDMTQVWREEEECRVDSSKKIAARRAAGSIPARSRSRARSGR